MPRTCKVKTFHEYKGFSGFKFANKDVYNQENFLKFPFVLLKLSIWFFGEFSFRKGKLSCYWIIVFLCRVIKMKFYWFIATFLFFFFLKDKKLNKLPVALKFHYFLTVLSLYSTLFYQWFLLVLFPCKDPLHCINLQREGTTIKLRV